MNEVLHANGKNDYKLPHTGKNATIRRTGHDLPLRLPCTIPLPPIHPHLATHAVASVASVQTVPAIISPASSPTNANITHLDVPADADQYDSDERENDDSLIGDGGGGDEDDDKMGIDSGDPHEDLQEAMM